MGKLNTGGRQRDAHEPAAEASRDTSIVFSFDAAESDRRNALQYFEMFCNRGIAKPSRFGGRISWSRTFGLRES